MMKLLPPFLAILFAACASISNDKAHLNEPSAASTKMELIVVKQQFVEFEPEKKADTIFTKDVDLAKTKIDLYFSNNNIQIPYYLPTNGIYRDRVKDKECNWKIYPADVRCYKYDAKNRVVEMRIEGSGVMGNYTFIYDDGDKIIEMSNSEKYKMTYDRIGNLLQIAKGDAQFQKVFYFYYVAKPRPT